MNAGLRSASHEVMRVHLVVLPHDPG